LVKIVAIGLDPEFHIKHSFERGHIYKEGKGDVAAQFSVRFNERLEKAVERVEKFFFSILFSSEFFLI
jgi:hypothetical protein